jgi:hypothetical protein
MLTISLLVTGKTELCGLASSLQRVFPADFRYVNPLGVDPHGHINGFTSRDCSQLLSRGIHPESDLGWFVAHLIAEAFPGRRGHPPDLVIGIDDVELVNIAHTQMVVEVLRNAVRAHIDRNWNEPAKSRVYAQLRENCSFHLFKPMVEAYFFGEHAALDRAGRAQERISRFDAERCDPEDFLVDDADYQSIPEPPKAETRRTRMRRNLKVSTGGTPNIRRDPAVSRAP